MWLDTDRFDVVAKAPAEHSIDADGSFRKTWSMIRRLLADRFKLRLHEENKERSVYALMLVTTAGTLGPRLHKTDIDCGEVMRGQLALGQRWLLLRAPLLLEQSRLAPSQLKHQLVLRRTTPSCSQRHQPSAVGAGLRAGSFRSSVRT